MRPFLDQKAPFWDGNKSLWWPGLVWSNVSEVRFLRAAAFATGGLCGVPRQADVLETGDFGGDKLSRLFRLKKRISEHCKHLEPVFGGKRANYTKDALFGVRRFQRFLLQKRSGDEAVTSLVTSVFWPKFGCFGGFFGQKSQKVRVA